MTTSNELALDVGTAFARSVARTPDKRAVIEDGGRAVTYAELDARARAFAASLQALGIGPGERVAIDLTNSIELVVAYLAVARIGAIVTFANPQYRSEELRHQLRDAGARAIVIHATVKGFDCLAMIDALRPELPALEHVIVVGAAGGHPSFERLCEEGRAIAPRDVAVDPARDLATLLYTGGTTGLPKGVCHTHAVNMHRAGVAAELAGWTADDVFLAPLPLYHSFGLSSILNPALALSATIVAMGDYHPERALQLVEQHRVTIHHAAPTHLLLEMNHPQFARYDLSSLRTGFAGGFAWPPELFQRAEARMGLRLFHAWGMTEVGGLGIACAPDDPRRDTFLGRAVPGARVHVVDPETGAELPPGTPGELAFAGPMFREYWQNPAATARAIDAAGRLRTGDQAIVDADGYVRLTSRLKEIIKKGGYSIGPNEIEGLVCEHPRVKEACVVALPDPLMGEVICACVVTRDGGPLPLAELREFLRGKIAAYKLPDELSRFEEFPRLAGGIKIRRFGPESVQERALADPHRERFRR